MIEFLFVWDLLMAKIHVSSIMISDQTNNTNVASIVSVFSSKLSKQQTLCYEAYRTSDNLGINFIQAYIDVKSMTEY